MDRDVLASILIIAAVCTIGFFAIYKSPKPEPQAPVSANKACYIGGCSGEVCSDTEGVASNCIYKPEFACYKTAKCERQATGECGWTETSELKSCLSLNLDAGIY
jgi:hypothetical protein